ncbi:hypothetical protein CRUP_014633 [Coryphaenoides rupestris]|nr:hypothetical protein CRUP_014633 [Coryphaenoides rupestris]
MFAQRAEFNPESSTVMLRNSRGPVVPHHLTKRVEGDNALFINKAESLYGPPGASLTSSMADSSMRRGASPDSSPCVAMM